MGSVWVLLLFRRHVSRHVVGGDFDDQLPAEPRSALQPLRLYRGESGSISTSS